MRKVIWGVLAAACFILCISVLGPELLGTGTFFDTGKTAETPWNLQLVNPQNPIPDGYDTELTEISGGGGTGRYANL